MKLVLSEEHQLLRESAADFVRSKSSLKRIRALRDAGDGIGFSRDLWREMAALGWAGIFLPESLGGSGLGDSHLMVVMEELGRGLMPEPMLATILASAAMLLAGSDEQKRSLLPAVASGESIATLAFHEATSRYDPTRVSTRAERKGDRWVLTGEKRFVPCGGSADWMIVPARPSGDGAAASGITLFMVEGRAKGLSATPQQLIDARPCAVVRLDGVEVDDTGVLGGVDRGGSVLLAAIDRATAALCAEMLGSTLAAFDATLDYLKTRKQFGVLIGTFQALKHRAANVYTETELSRSAAMAACFALEENNDKARSFVSLAKARLSDAFVLAANEAVQMHGGIGMTDEHDIGFFLKRARVAEMTFGDAAWHRNRYAALQGY